MYVVESDFSNPAGVVVVEELIRDEVKPLEDNSGFVVIPFAN